MKKYNIQRHDAEFDKETDEEEEKKEGFVKLLYSVWADKNLTSNERVLYSEIKNFIEGKKSVCTASNQYFAKEWNVSEQFISRLISSLRKKGYIKILLYHYKNSSGQQIGSKRSIKLVSEEARERVKKDWKERNKKRRDDWETFNRNDNKDIEKFKKTV